jgi:hypothetical protein
MMRKSVKSAGSVLAATIAVLVPFNAWAAAITSEFSSDYTLFDLGPVPGLAEPFGGLTLLPDDPNTLLIGGNANNASGRLNTIGVSRNVDGHITGFSGTATPFGNVGEYNDGGVVFGPTGVLFTARWPVNELGQTKPGSTDEDRIDDLSPLGIGGSSIAAVNFVPEGFAGAGDFKGVSWPSGNWYTINLSPDGAGTFNIDSVTEEDLDSSTPGTQGVPGGPEGFVYVDLSNPSFSVDSMLVSEWSANNVAAYEIDGNGNPLVSTRREFITGLTGAEGAFLDPVTGDFLFSTFGSGSDRVLRVEGFTAPTPPPANPVPIPHTIFLLLTGLASLFMFRTGFQ